MSEKRLIQVITLPVPSVVIAEEDYQVLETLDRVNEQLRQELSLAEEGLANATQEIVELRGALVKYGAHTAGCSNKRNVGDCSCGLWQVVRSSKPQTGDPK